MSVGYYLESRERRTDTTGAALDVKSFAAGTATRVTSSNVFLTTGAALSTKAFTCGDTFSYACAPRLHTLRIVP